ncbi:hypothetical protein [Gymnodinialimonas ulvae]|uniref:hypothetical protein n=1 Tax=Gymnodinialimonas ulvae TaxID=3126504 RepID=UPI00309ACE14
MISRIWLALGASIALAGCVATTPEGQFEEGLPEEVLALVGPGQDTSSVRLEADGCYWYLHRGPVESTYIPLMTRDQRMICVTA